MSLMVFPWMVMITLWRGEADTPSIKTPARMTVTGAGAGVFF
jgi:hypothetical protein